MGSQCWQTSDSWTFLEPVGQSSLTYLCPPLWVPSTATKLGRCSVDWTRTEGWSHGFLGSLFLKVAGHMVQFMDIHFWQCNHVPSAIIPVLYQHFYFSVYMSISTCLYVYTHILFCVSVFVCMFICIFLSLKICVSVYRCLCLWMHICVHT